VLHISHCRKISNEFRDHRYMVLTEVVWFKYETPLFHRLRTPPHDPHASVTFAALVRFKYETPLFHRLRTPPHDPHASVTFAALVRFKYETPLFIAYALHLTNLLLSHSQPLFIQYLPRPGLTTHGYPFVQSAFTAPVSASPPTLIAGDAALEYAMKYGHVESRAQ